MTGRRAVITGAGVVAPSGIGVDEHWRSVTGQCNRIGRISHFDPTQYESTLAGEVTGLDVADIDGRVVVQSDRWTWMALVAAQEAVDRSGLDLSELDPYALAVGVASSSGGNHYGQQQLQRLWSSGTVTAYQSIAWFYAATVGQMSLCYGAKGPSSVLATEAAGGLDSLAHAARHIRRGGTVMLAGGLEAPLSPYALVCQQRSGRLTRSADPTSAYVPFDHTASGYVPGEGGAVLMVEELEHALARDAPEILGEIVGWSSTHDGAHTCRGGPALVRHYAAAMRQALERAGCGPEDVDLFIPDALGTPRDDVAEAAAVREVFGTRAVPVTSHKSLIGRLYQGGSALDVVSALWSMRSGVVPAFAGLRQPGPGRELAFVDSLLPHVVDVVMVGARGFDGFNSALVLRRVDRSAELS